MSVFDISVSCYCKLIYDAEEERIIFEKSKKILSIFIFIIAGILISGEEVKFIIDIVNGNYEKISATIVNYKEYKTELPRGRMDTSYSKIYEYKDGQKFKRYESSVVSKFDLGNIGDKEFLYRNIKTNEVRDKPYDSSLLVGMLFIGVGILKGIFFVIRKRTD